MNEEHTLVLRITIVDNYSYHYEGSEEGCQHFIRYLTRCSTHSNRCSDLNCRAVRLDSIGFHTELEAKTALQSLIDNTNNNNNAEAYNITHEAEEVEESLSLVEKESDLIRKALKKHKGKRKLAANELGISERTLYRKIKELDL